MKLFIYSVYDIKGEIFNAPFFVRSPADAVRSFSQLVSDPKTTINQYPEDYALYELGVFNDDRAYFDLHEIPKHSVSAVSLIKG